MDIFDFARQNGLIYPDNIKRYQVPCKKCKKMYEFHECPWDAIMDMPIKSSEYCDDCKCYSLVKIGKEPNIKYVPCGDHAVESGKYCTRHTCNVSGCLNPSLKSWTVNKLSERCHLHE